MNKTANAYTIKNICATAFVFLCVTKAVSITLKTKKLIDAVSAVERSAYAFEDAAIVAKQAIEQNIIDQKFIEIIDYYDE